MLTTTSQGLYSSLGDFSIDPLRPVPVALITHAHGDHARSGSSLYYIQRSAMEILRYRLGDVALHPLDYGEKIKFGSVWVSFHPAGHILGSSQIRIESASEVAVVSGDYKRACDPTCLPFEPQECDLFVTESTFALPIYHWEEPNEVARSIYEWWQKNAEENRPSLLFCYTLGKAQRILALLKKWTDREIYVHGSIQPINAFYANQGILLSPTKVAAKENKEHNYSKELILAPPSAYRSLWMRRFKNARTAFASGWMAVRGTRRRQGFDQGFVLSDHADWEELLATIRATKAKQIWVTHGEIELFSRYLNEVENIKADPLPGFATVEED